MGLGEFGLQPDRLAVGSHCTAHVARLAQVVTQVGVGQGDVWLEADRLLVRHDRPGQHCRVIGSAAPFLQVFAIAAQVAAVLGTAAHQVAPDRPGLRPTAASLQRVRQLVTGQLRLPCPGNRVGADCLLRLRRPYPHQHIAQRVVDRGIVRVGPRCLPQHRQPRVHVARAGQGPPEQDQARRCPRPGFGPLNQRPELAQPLGLILDEQGGAEGVPVGVEVGGAPQPGPEPSLRCSRPGRGGRPPNRPSPRPPASGGGPPRCFLDGGAGGFRLTPIGSVDGGLELLVEFWPRRALRSWTCCFNEGLGLDARRGGAEGLAATTAGRELTVGAIEVDDPLVGEGADPAMVDRLATLELNAIGAWEIGSGRSGRVWCGRGGRWSPWSACSGGLGNALTSTQAVSLYVKAPSSGPNPVGIGEKSPHLRPCILCGGQSSRSLRLPISDRALPSAIAR